MLHGYQEGETAVKGVDLMMSAILRRLELFNNDGSSWQASNLNSLASFMDYWTSVILRGSEHADMQAGVFCITGLPRANEVQSRVTMK